MINTVVHIFICHLSNYLRHYLLICTLLIAQNILEPRLSCKRFDLAEQKLDRIKIWTCDWSKHRDDVKLIIHLMS